MRNDRDWVLWQEYQGAWKRAEMLQSLWERDSLLSGVIYDRRERRWIVNCVDTARPITERIRGGHRRCFAEVWRGE